MKAQIMEGKVAIVTGGSKGIGQAIAEMYAKEGAKVVITARGQKALDEEVARIKEMGGEAIGVVADQARAEDTLNVFKTTLDTYGGLDVVVCNAGVGENVKIEATPDELFEEVLNINTVGVFRYVREACKIFLPKQSGSIIVVSSVNGVRPMCGVSYCTSKGAVNMMVKNVGIRLSGTGVRINGLLPGYTYTPLSNKQELSGGIPTSTENFDPMDLGQRMNPPEEYSTLMYLRNLTRRVDQIKGERLGTYPEDQAYAALYLGSDMSRAVNGQRLMVDNGTYI